MLENKFKNLKVKLSKHLVIQARAPSGSVCLDKGLLTAFLNINIFIAVGGKIGSVEAMFSCAKCG